MTVDILLNDFGGREYEKYFYLNKEEIIYYIFWLFSIIIRVFYLYNV